MHTEQLRPCPAIYAYGIFCYDFYTVAASYARLVVEQALRDLWGSRTRPPALTWVLGSSLVFVDEASEDGPALDPL
jgi:hypothetical protein